MKSYPFAVVYWIDAFGDSESFDEETSNFDGIETLTIGWLMQDDDKGVTVSQDRYAPDSPFSRSHKAFTFIPRGCIIKVLKRRAPSGAR